MKVMCLFDQELQPLIEIKNYKFWFPLAYLSFNERISLKFMWYMTVIKIQVDYEKGRKYMLSAQ